ncbi:MAG: hypothetical protein WCD18_11370 [Thermosynechococcaceae cyanobacterium]
MKSRWQIYRELELISDRVIQPKTSLLLWLFRPVRRSLARTFVRDLAHKHRILLFERCLKLDPTALSTPSEAKGSLPRSQQHPNALTRQGSYRDLLRFKQCRSHGHDTTQGMAFDFLEL